MIVARGSSVNPRASPAASTRLVSFLSAMTLLVTSQTAGWVHHTTQLYSRWVKPVNRESVTLLSGCLSPAIAACLVMWGPSHCHWLRLGLQPGGCLLSQPTHRDSGGSRLLQILPLLLVIKVLMSALEMISDISDLQLIMPASTAFKSYQSQWQCSDHRWFYTYRYIVDGNKCLLVIVIV